MRVAIPILLAVLAAAPPARAEGPVRFLDTPAAQAFQQGRYADAVSELERLVETNPDNVLVLRYLAMSYDRVGRYADALRTYAKALSRQPSNAALLYHSGETLYNAHFAADAKRHFELVLSLAPDSEYAANARAYLDALSQQRVARQSPGAPRIFGLYIEVGFSGDEYTYIDTDRKKVTSRSERITEYASLDVNLLRTTNWLASLDLSGYGAQDVGGDDGRRDLWQNGAGATLQHNGMLGAVPAVGTLRGFGLRTRYDGGPDYSDTAGASAGLQLRLTRESLTRLHYRYSRDMFEDDGFDAALSSRDADVHEGGLRHTAYFAKRTVWVTLSGAYEENHAEGRNFDYDGFEVGASISVPLVLDVRLDLGVTYAEEDYTSFAGPVARETERTEYEASLTRWIGRSLLARARYAWVDEDSTIDVLSYEREGYGVSIAYVY